ncbi:hypothetical protein RJ640_026935 [Escallonia rubra]|uniref:Amino acid transporter transmembrane domain-containing protein n=1 Tax=Escallonia rubra TaxID=112253 RepID=A0AA88UJY7_9ASTE|nr:hypothetical protein RJ640_026935 [Escallonia rubra]
MGAVYVKDVMILANQMPAVRAFGSPSMFFYGLGVATYSFEGIGMALPLESEMKDKSKFAKISGLTMLFTALMYSSFGVFGYFAFGENTKDIITANLGEGWVSTSVKLGLCVNLFFTFPLMMNPVYEVFERRFWDGNYCLWMRWGVVLVVSLVALLVPNFTDFLSLVGSSTCCGLGFVLPALFHYRAFTDEMGWKGRCLDLSIIVLGAFLGLSGTWFSLSEILSVKPKDLVYTQSPVKYYNAPIILALLMKITCFAKDQKDSPLPTNILLRHRISKRSQVVKTRWSAIEIIELHALAAQQLTFEEDLCQCIWIAANSWGQYSLDKIYAENKRFLTRLAVSNGGIGFSCL